MSADALIAVADAILATTNNLSATEISKKGRKYKFVNDTFQRIRKEDRHLVVHPEDLSQRLSVVLAHSILQSIDPQLFTLFPDVCLTIIGTADMLEQNQWYEEENSSVIPYRSLKVNFSEEQRIEASEFARLVSQHHLDQGYTILYCAKLDFLHTDHHIGTRLDGIHMRHYVEQFFGDSAVESLAVLAALKSFVHWANIKGLLWKLDVPYLAVDDDLRTRFASFPDPPQLLKESVMSRYPSGTSKYSLIRKSLDILADFDYAKIIPFPKDDPRFDLTWLFQVCQNIERDPVRYHLRASAKKLSDNPANLMELSKNNAEKIKALLAFISLVVNTFNDTGGEYLLQNSKLPEFSDALIDEYSNYYKSLIAVNDKIIEYREKGWAHDDIVLRLYNSNFPNIYDEVMNMRQSYDWGISYMEPARSISFLLLRRGNLNLSLLLFKIRRVLPDIFSTFVFGQIRQLPGGIY